jgi:serine acetyltransferase
VVRGDIPDYAVAVGAPARLIRDRRDDQAIESARRAALADIARKTQAAVDESLEDRM